MSLLDSKRRRFGTVSVRLDEPLMAALQELSKELGVSRSAIISAALRGDHGTLYAMERKLHESSFLSLYQP